ncbi:hypothetical protein F4811DRAFT_160939 [Daldinia bambusicola]|nr:hypothetical protein F4811DRAFT_160939 [Daldinia bambusicola]
MHNTTFIPHTSSTQPPSSSTNTRASDSSYHSVTKTGLKRLPSSESLVSIGRKPPRTSGSTGTGTRTGTRTIISTSTTATTIAKTSITAATVSSSASSSSRAPLRRRNQNAAPVTIPLLKEPGTGNMPFDTSSPPLASPNPNSSRPQMPSLSASAARVVNRNPLTPKIASKTGAQSPGLSAAAISTGRRQHPPSAIITSREAPSNRSSYFDDSSSISSHLTANVTPRSGSRQTRVDSANNTPNGTPNPDKSDAWDHRSSFGLPSPRTDGDVMRRSGTSFGSASPDTASYRRQEGAYNIESKFFHASDAKPPRPLSSSKPAQAKGPTIFYANGNTVENKPSHPTPFAPVLGHSQDSLSSKFMYANGTPEMRSSPTPPVSRSSGSTVSTAPRPPSNRPAINPPASSHTQAQRPASPAKFSSQGSQVSSKTTNIPSGRPPALSTPQLAPSPGLRRSSTGLSRTSGHSRTGSLVKLDHSSTTPKPTSSRVSPETSPPITVPPTPAPLTLASIIQAAEDFAENEECASPDEAPSGLQSPTNPANPTEPVNESVANARRERKVQDLQITNASLEAINRTLERKLRKQTSELRRYQRLSRSGRLSTASTVVESQTSLKGASEQGLGVIDLSDLDENSEAEELEKEMEMEEELSDSDSVNESLSPSVVAERDAKHRKRDEERLHLDLSKHQQLLVDSQKINQSIRRCLDWTEVLINEGKKALEYRAPIVGVELGGRVLAPDEEEDRPSTANSISDNTIEFDGKFLDDPISLAGWGGSERQDRDSGIELQVDGG